MCFTLKRALEMYLYNVIALWLKYLIWNYPLILDVNKSLTAGREECAFDSFFQNEITLYQRIFLQK